MLTVRYFQIQEIDDKQLKYAIIAASYMGKWLFCRQKGKSTFELPAGRREKGESIIFTAERELREETGAIRFSLIPLLAIHVAADGLLPDKNSDFGLFCLARVDDLGELPDELEMDEVIISDEMPDKLSYPVVQPQLFALAKNKIDLLEI